MEKIHGIALPSAQLAMLQRMQHTALAATAGAVSPAQIFSTGIQPAGAASFTEMLSHAIHSVDGVQHSAAAKQTAVETGISDDLTGAMVESQKASVSFAAMVQVRNKLSSALDEIMNMAV